MTNYYLYGESLIYYFKHILTLQASFLPTAYTFAQHHRLISFGLYTIGTSPLCVSYSQLGLESGLDTRFRGTPVPAPLCRLCQFRRDPEPREPEAPVQSVWLDPYVAPLDRRFESLYRQQHPRGARTFSD